MVDEQPKRVSPHLLAALDAFQRRSAAGLSARADEHGLRLRGSHGRILDLVAPEGSRPVQLAEGGWISRQAMGKRLQELTRLGLVASEPDASDGRATVVRRTLEGERVRRTIRRSIEDVEREFAGQVGADRYGVFRAVLDELAWGDDAG